MKTWSKLKTLFRRRKADADMSEEIRLHLELQTERNLAAGMDPAEARYAARRMFGDVEQIKEHCREQRRWMWVEDTLRDARHALRSLRKTPGFTLVAVLTVALGIGSCTAMFSVINGVLLRPLAVEQPGMLVQLWEERPDRIPVSVSAAILAEWRDQSTLLERISAMQSVKLNLGDVAEPVRLEGLLVSTDFVDLLRLRPALGRSFLPEEGQPGRANVILLSHAVWRRSFGGDPGVIGRTVRFGAEDRVVVGVLPPHPLLSHGADFLMPFLHGSEEWHRQRGDHRLRVIARIKSGATLAQVRAELQAIAARNCHLNPAWKRDWSVAANPLQEEMTGEVRPALLLLFGAVVLVLLIACANLANLLLAKATARQHEIAVRLAIGGSRGRIVRLLLTEGLVLALIGGAAGLLGAAVAVDAVARLSEQILPRAQEITMDGRVLGFALVAATATGLLFGAAPAWSLSRRDAASALANQSRTTSPAGDRLRSALIVGQVALALMLTVGAGLLMRSLGRLLAVSPGFVPTQVLAASVSLDARSYPDTEARAALFREIERRLTAEPGVAAVGVITALPMRHRNQMLVRLDHRPDQPEEGIFTEYAQVAGDVFAALGMTRLRGRSFEERDQRPGAPPTIVVNQAFADELFPEENPIGRGVDVWGRNHEIIGVVNDVRHNGLDQKAPRQIYLPEAHGVADVHLLVRATGAPGALEATLRRAMGAIDARLPLGEVRTLDQMMVDTMAPRRLVLALLSVFAGTALLLVTLGLAGVTAYSVARRTREFGIRLALGATRGEIMRLVLGRGARLTAIGVAIGLGGALALTRALRAWLFETSPTDAPTFAVVTAMLMLVSLLACALPARRATKVDPMVALRCE